MATVGDTFMAQPPGASNPYQDASNLMGQAGEAYGGIAAGNPIYESMNAYLNPYYDEVISDVQGRMVDQRNRDLMRVGDQAVAGGAFGGSRHGLVESELYDTTQRNIGEMTNQMLADRFNTAAGLGAQDVGYNLAGAGGLANLGNQYFNVGNTLADRQMQQGTMQQQLLQSILGGAAGQFNDYMNSPQQALTLLSGVLNQDPRQNNATQQYTPGLYDYLGLGAQMGGAYLGGK